MSNEELCEKIQQETDINGYLMELYDNNSGFVHQAIKRYAGRMELEDAEQISFLAIREAAVRYDQSFDCKFLTYCDTWLRQMLTVQASSSSVYVPYHVRDDLRALKAMQKSLEKAGIPATEETLCRSLLWTPERLQDVRSAAQRAISLYSAASSNADNDVTVEDVIEDPAAGEAFEDVERKEIASMVRRAVDKLPDVQRECVKRKYWHEETADQIAEGVGISASQVRYTVNAAQRSLRRDKTMKAAAEEILTGMAYQHRGVSMFTRTNESVVEHVALFHLRQLEKQSGL